MEYGSDGSFILTRLELIAHKAHKTKEIYLKFVKIQQLIALKVNLTPNQTKYF